MEKEISVSKVENVEENILNDDVTGLMTVSSTLLNTDTTKDMEQTKSKVSFNLAENSKLKDIPENNINDNKPGGTTESEDLSMAETQPYESNCDNKQKEVDNDFQPAKLIGIGTKMDSSHQLIEIKSRSFRMGRSFEADVTIKDINVSREQALFQFSKGEWTIMDNSSNGIRVNGGRISKGVPCTIQFKDKILFSDQIEKYMWKFVSFMDKENVDDSNTRKRKCDQEGSSKRLKLDSGCSGLGYSVNIVQAQRIQKEKILRKMENDKVERARVEKLVQEERTERERVEKKMEEERQERERIVKQMEEDKKEREELALQLREQKLANEAEREKLEAEMLKMKSEKERIETEQRCAMEELKAKEEQTREEMRRKEEENREKQEQIFKRIEEEKLKASSTAEERDKRIAELEKAMTAAKEEAAAIILQEVEEKQQISEERAAEKQRLEEEKQKYESEMLSLRAEKERMEADKNRRVAEVMAEKAAQDEERRSKEEEILAKQQEILAQIKTEQARASSSEEENRMKESRIKELEKEMSNTEEEAKKIKQQGAKEVLDAMEDTLEQQLICPTCLELPIHPVILNCGHSYCWLCLNQWKKISKKCLCPQCRVVISTETKGISMDNMIEAIISQLGPAKVEERKLRVEQRCEQEKIFKEGGDNSGGANRGRGGNRGGPINARGGQNQRGGRRGGRGGNQPQGRDGMNDEQRYYGRGSGHNANRGRGHNGHRGGQNDHLVRGRGNVRPSVDYFNRHNRVGVNDHGHRLGGHQDNHGRNNDRGGHNHNQQDGHNGVAAYFSRNNPINIPTTTNVVPTAQQTNNSRHITVLSDHSGNRNSAVNRTTATAASTTLVTNSSARGIVLNGNAQPQPLSNRAVQIISFGDALAARAASAAANNINSINLANRDETSSGQINNQTTNIQSSVLGPGPAVDNVAAEVVVHTTAGPAGGGSEPAAAIYVSSDDEEDSDNEGSENDTDSDLEDNSDIDLDDYDSDASSVEGLPGSFYGGYGQCYLCDRRGHWAPGCPF